ncbi:MAG: hypothetical protein EBS34_03370 [Flavobacteriales bacterium]|nr:hypothetical protein [Flavobacteriales bacterium]
MSKIAQIEQPERTDLAKHEVNLALMDEVKLNLKNVNDTYKKMLKAEGVIKKSIAAINGELKSSGIDINPKYGTNVIATAKKFQSQLEKTAKELGVNLQGSELDKQISELYNLGDSAQQIIDGVNNLVKTIGK